MTVMITRRTIRRTHLFRPDPEVNNLFTYLLAVLSARHGVQVHAAVLMSTHEHLVVTDVRGELPRFLQDFHRLFALGVKVLRNWDGSVWDNQKTSVVELRTPEAIVEKLAYVIANPVEAGLVKRAHQWPGVTTRPADLGSASWTAYRPKVYVDRANPCWPTIAVLKLSSPMIDRTDSSLRVVVADEVGRLEEQERVNLRASGCTAAGAERVARGSPFKRATSVESSRARNPVFAVGSGQHDALRLAVAAVKAFRAAHRFALDGWRRAIRDISFPAGTWLMRRVHCAVVATQ